MNEIKTYGIKYAGSKLKLLPYIYESIKNLPIHTVFDGFAGTTRVSQMFAQRGYQVISNDIAPWSEVFNLCFLCATEPYEYYQPIIDTLNSLEGIEGWFTNNYSLELSGMKKAPFRKNNLMKLDAIREYIENQNYNVIDKAVLLTSLILALDKVDNTLGHFTSYLKDWSARSADTLFLEVPRYNVYQQPHLVLRDNVFNILPKISIDLAYYDPPYGSNNEKMPSSRVRYNAYYHFWTSVILYDKPELFGKAHRRQDSRDTNISIFEEYKKDKDNNFIAINAINELIHKTNASYILFSYSNGGRATKEELNQVFSKECTVEKIFEINYKMNVMQAMSWTNEWTKKDQSTIEYLFLLKKEIKNE